MAGIYGLFLKEIEIRHFYKNFYNADFKNSRQDELDVEQGIVGRSVLNRLEKDRFLFQNEQYTVCFEGVNFSNLRTPEQIIQAFQSSGIDFVSQLKGVFSGFLYDKRGRKLYIFNDPYGSKKIYYYHHREKGLAFSSEMHTLSKFLRENGISITPDMDGIYCLAIYGQMLREITVVKEIKRLKYASVLIYDFTDNSLEEKSYYTFKKQVTQQNLPEIIENVNHYMVEAVKQEWDKDLEYGKGHFTLMSGGMDSRTNALMAKALGYQKIIGYTYGNPDSSDVKIANSIADKNFYGHLQYNLNNGDFFLENILAEYIKPVDGLVHFTASAIIHNVMKAVNFENYGTMHSGQLGDIVFGSFFKPKYDLLANRDKIGLSGFVKKKEMMNKISFLEEMLNEHQHSDTEVFSFEQRVVNGTLFGDNVFSNFVDQTSPFYDLDLLKYTFTIPDRYKLNQQIYFLWLKAKFPEILDYKWEKIDLKPNSNFNLKYGKIAKKYVNGGKKYFNLRYNSMNPISTWFKENPLILQKFDTLYKENIHLIKDTELRRDLEEIYKDDIFEYRNKFAVLSVLLSIKLHFG